MIKPHCDWQAHLVDDESLREIYVDRDLSRWKPSRRDRLVCWLRRAIRRERITPPTK